MSRRLCRQIEVERELLQRLLREHQSGPNWHRALLERMAAPGPGRAAVVFATVGDALKRYLEFRHVFRHAYPFQLRWEYMRPLAVECGALGQRLDADLAAFCDSLGKSGEAPRGTG